MAAFAHNYVVSIIGPKQQPLREKQEDGQRTIRLPFDSEYKIRIKNKRLTRAKVQVLIDGMDVSPGSMFVVQPNQTFDLERFMLDGNNETGQRFKFISKEKGKATGEIQDPTNSDLGLIEVKFFEEQFNLTTGFTFTSTQIPPVGYAASAAPTFYGAINNYHVGASFNSLNCNASSARSSNDALIAKGGKIGHVEEKLDEGGTALGGVSYQRFQQTNDFQTAKTPISLTIQLKGPEQNAMAFGRSKSGKMDGQFAVINRDGHLVEFVDKVTLTFDVLRNFLEAVIHRTNPQTGDYITEVGVVELSIEPSAYHSSKHVTVLRLLTPLSGG